MSVNLSNYAVDQLQSLIAEAQQELEKKRSEARSAKVKEIRRLAAEAGLEVDIKGARTARASAGALPARYRNPAAPNQTWTGRGPRPKWFKDALAKGKSPVDLAV